MVKSSAKNINKKIWSFLVAIPMLLPVMLAMFGAVAVLFLVIGNFNLIFILFIGLPLSLLIGYITYKLLSAQVIKGTVREYRLVSVLALLGVVVWIAINIQFNSQHVFTNRDPAIYSIAGAWLVDHDNLSIERYKNFESIGGIVSGGAGFANSVENDTYIEAQGVHLLPALMGVVGRLFGVNAMFNTNVIIGGIALFAFFAFSRLLIRSRWALMGTATLAATLPMIYFSRDSYTEPLALLLVFSALSFTIVALRARSWQPWLIAGFLFGLGALTRIDAYLTIAAALIFMTILLITISKDRTRDGLYSGIFILGMATSASLGFLDVRYLSSNYFTSEWPQIKPELILVATVIIIGLVLVLVPIIRKSIISYYKKRKLLLAKLLPWSIIVVALILSTRPLWLSFSDVEVARNYNTTTVNWIVWYAGILVVILGFIGFAIMAKRMLFERKSTALSMLVVLIVVLSASMLYLVRPSIFPDQIWASRRLLPIIIPGFIFATMFILDYLYDNKWSNKIIKLGINKKVFISIIATVVIISPVLATMPFINKTSFGQKQSIDSLCHALPKNSAILWMGIAGREVLMPSRTFCDRSIVSVGYRFSAKDGIKIPTREALSRFANIAKQEGLVPLVGFYGYEDEFSTLKNGESNHISTQVYSNIEYINDSLPRSVVGSQVDVYLAGLTQDGIFRALR